MKTLCLIKEQGLVKPRTEKLKWVKGQWEALGFLFEWKQHTGGPQYKAELHSTAFPSFTKILLERIQENTAWVNLSSSV